MTSDPLPSLSDMPLSEVIARAMKSDDATERRRCLDHIEDSLENEGQSAIDDFDRFWLGCAYSVASGDEFWNREGLHERTPQGLDQLLHSPLSNPETMRRHRYRAIRLFEQVLDDRDGLWYDEVVIELAFSLDIRDDPGDRDRARALLEEVNETDPKVLAHAAMVLAGVLDSFADDPNDDSPSADERSRGFESEAITVLERMLAEFDTAREMLQKEIDDRKESFAILYGKPDQD